VPKLDDSQYDFLATIIHQLRTPLASVKWALNLILAGEAGPLTDEQKKLLARSVEGNDRVLGLINEILSADRINSETIKYYFTPTDLIKLIKATINDMAETIARKGIKIEIIEPKKPLPLIPLDPSQITSVLQNLLENSVRYTGEKGKISIKIALETDVVKITVKDNGIGIPSSEQKDIFEKFFRANNAIQADPHGYGLGLFIVKNILEKHSGRIWFESEEKKGTEFYFTLPLSRPETD